jgi:hypothetical protein
MLGIDGQQAGDAVGVGGQVGRQGGVQAGQQALPAQAG